MYQAQDRIPRDNKRLPLLLHWQDPEFPLPMKSIKCSRAVSTFPSFLTPGPWLNTGDRRAAFDFCGHIRTLCEDVVARCEAFRHIEVDRLLIAVTQSRNRRIHGLQARITPLRFPGGKLTIQRRGVVFQVQRYVHNNVDILYIITFCLPRFLNQDFDGKLTTLFHELYHISPEFDGDLRRYGGRYALHTHSQKQYDHQMAQLAREYLNKKPRSALTDFLRMNAAQLEHKHGSIAGIVVRRPKIIPISRCR